MASIKIQLYKHKTFSDGSHPIIMQIIKDRKKRTLWLGYKANKDHWDSESSLPNEKHPNSTRLANHIRQKLIESTDVILDLDKKKKPYSVQDIFNQLSDSKGSSTFINYTEEIIEKLKTAGKLGNSRVYQYTLNSVKKFRKDKDIPLKEIDYKFISDYENYLHAEKCRTNTIAFYLRTLRAIINKAIKEEIIPSDNYPFSKFSIKSQKTQKRAITKDDIASIKKVKLEEGTDIALAKDLFLFSFYNRGMSFVDMAHLKVKDIQSGRITYSRRKTGQKFSIKITDFSKEIIDRYNDLSDPESYIFPILLREGQEYLDYRNAMRLMNKKLKKIAKLADIEAPLTTYVSRHSWATIAKRSGIPTAIISEGLGHDSEETTQIYLDSFDHDVLDDANEIIIK